MLITVRANVGRVILNRDSRAAAIRISANGIFFGPLGMSRFTDTNLSQFNALKSRPQAQPFDQLTQLRFKSVAVYPDGESVDSADAFEQYFRAVFKVLYRVGAESIWRGTPSLTLIGPDSGHWDWCSVTRFPSFHAYRALLNDPNYLDALLHWNAAVEDSRVYCVDSGPI